MEQVSIEAEIFSNRPASFFNENEIKIFLKKMQQKAEKTADFDSHSYIWTHLQEINIDELTTEDLQMFERIRNEEISDNDPEFKQYAESVDKSNAGKINYASLEGIGSREQFVAFLRSHFLVKKAEQRIHKIQ